jgi:hypothetical protein
VHRGPVTSLVELTLVVEHRRGHGAMYDALNAGRVEPERLTAAPPAGNSPLGSPSGRFSVHSRIRVSCPQAARRRNVPGNIMQSSRAAFACVDLFDARRR